MIKKTTCKSLPGMTLLFLTSLLVMAGCRKKQAEETVLPYQETANLVYGADSLQHYDLFLPAGRNQQTRVIVLIHGGGWVSGEKQDCDYYAMRFARLGFAAISMNYRLANDSVHYADMLDDIDSMAVCIRKNAGHWSIGSGQLSLFGYSAGGHLALLYSYSRDKARAVKSVISVAGPTNIQDSLLWHIPWFYQDIKLMTGDTMPEHWTNGNPVDFVSATNPPTLLIHGSNDSLIAVSQSLNLSMLLQASGVPVKLLVLQNETHFFSAEATFKVIDETKSFIDN